MMLSRRKTPVRPTTFVLVGLTGLALSLCTSLAVAQTTFTVSKVADTNDGTCDADCSLREAIAAANVVPGADAIEFAPAVHGQSIALANAFGQLGITDNVVIDTGGYSVTVAADGSHRVMEIFSGVNVTLRGLTITGGGSVQFGGGIFLPLLSSLLLENATVKGNTAAIPGAGSSGGGIYSGGLLTIVGSTISDNYGDSGGGIHTYGETSITRSTISGNTAAGGAGLYFNNQGSHTISVSNSSITGNSATSSGGGIVLYGQFGGSLQLSNNVIAGNTSGAGNAYSADCDGSPVIPIISLGHNVIGTGTGCPSDGTGDVTVAPGDVFTTVLDPALADNGGATQTHALLAGSPAIDIGGTCGPTDQRGFEAPADGDYVNGIACDAGAIEVPAPCDGPPRMAEPVVDPVTNRVTLTFEDADGITEIDFSALSNLVVIDSDGFTSTDGEVWSASGPAPTEVVFVLQQIDDVSPASFFVTILDQCSEAPEEASYDADINFDFCPADFDLLPSWDGNLTITGGDAPTASAVLSVPNGFKSIELHPDSRNIGLLDVEGLPVPPVGSGSGIFSTGVHPQLFSRLEYDGTSQTAPTEVTAVFGPETQAGSRFMFLLTDQNMCTLQVDPQIDFDAPTTIELHDNYPNPFNPTTSISFSLPVQSTVQLSVYDVTGRRIRSLASGEFEAGTHRVVWDATNDAGTKVTSGLYLYRLESNGISETRQMILLK